MNRAFLRAGALALLTLAACSSDAEDAPPPPESLFQNLPAASPGKLRGVWEVTLTQASGTIDIRLRFLDNHLVGAAKCTVNGAAAPVIAGSSVSLDSAALDAASGKVTFGALAFEKIENNVLCKASLPGATYDFTVDGTTLTLAGLAAPPFTKVGD